MNDFRRRGENAVTLQRTWMLPVGMLPVGMLLVAGLAGCGQRGRQSVTDEPEAIAERSELPADEPKREPTGPYIKRLVETEECFGVAGFEAYVFQFSGGFVLG
jgi:hypothetical protein